MLVTLLHNKPLLNEPGIKESNKSFKPYNKIITYKNLEIAILKNLNKEYISKNYNTIIQSLLVYYKKFINDNKKEINDYLQDLMKKNEKVNVETTGIYNMKITIDYSKVLNEFNNHFNNN